jgi:hypothetical protein
VSDENTSSAVKAQCDLGALRSMPDASTAPPLKKDEIPLVRHALMLAKRGMAVFPCLSGMKEPATKHGFLEATTDEGQIRRWWQENPDYNIGIATGVKSGIWVLDIDGGEGEAALRTLEQQYGPTPNTVEAISGGSGRHLFFKLPADRTIRNSTGKVAEHVDVRACGGYIIAAPSLHPSGRLYCWSVDSANTFADAPDWLLDRAAGPRKATHSRTAAAVTSAEWAMLLGAVVEGQRDCTVTKLAGHLLRHGVDLIVVLSLLDSFNATRCTPPLPAKDIERIVSSIARKEISRRRGHG